MLEWYRIGADYLDILADTEALVRQIARTLREQGGGAMPAGAVDVDAPWQRLTVSEAYQRYAGIALGVDRLMMTLTGAADIGEVTAFGGEECLAGGV